jgi:hypothetical protein
MYMSSLLLEVTCIPDNLQGITLLKDAHRAKQGLRFRSFRIASNLF